MSEDKVDIKEADIISKELSMARTAINYKDWGSVAQVLGLEMETKEFLSQAKEKWKLNEREGKVFEKWFTEGVRSNSWAWFNVTQIAFDIRNPELDKSTATLLFIDTYNRADEVFDEHRDEFIDMEHGRRVLNHDLKYTPILEMEDGDTANVGEFQAILNKILRNSEAYSKEEYQLVRWYLDSFVDTSTEAQRKFEGIKNYTFEDAYMLRFLTIGPMVDSISAIYATSRGETSDNNTEKVTLQWVEYFKKMTLAWQLVDDIYDLAEDYHKGNMNMMVGILREQDEMPGGFDETYYRNKEDLPRLFPKSVKRAKEAYDAITKGLPDEQMEFLNYRVPEFLYSKDFEFEY